MARTVQACANHAATLQPMSPPRHGRRRRVRRQRQVLIVILVLALVAIAAAKTHVFSTAAPSTTTATSLGTTSSTTPPSRTSAVGIIALHLVEPPSAGLPARSLETMVRYPALGTPGGSIPDATPLHGASPYPLVVFSQGFDVAPEAYARLLNSWAAAGYVVADPAYPYTSPNAPGGVIRSDIVHHPADLSFVISSLLKAGAASSGTLSHLINPSAIGVIGQSDGGDVSLAAVANTCCRDARIKAAVLLSGAELSWFPGTYFATPAVPLLVVQGTADQTMNPVTCSVQLYNAAPAPKFYLSMIGQDHFSAYIPAGPAQRVVTRVSIDFLDAYLRGSSAALRAMKTAGSVAGLAQLTEGAPVAPVAGTCPDAPAN